MQQTIDTLIYAGWIIPVEPAGVVLEHHALAIHEGKIVAILPRDEAVARFKAYMTHRLPTHVLIPGLINAHTHAAMSLFRGFADDLPLHRWLQERIWPAEQACVSEEFVADGTRLAIAEMLRSGITCFNDMYFFPDVTGEVVEQMGIRASLGLIVIDFPTIWAANADEYLQKAAQVYERFKDNPLITTMIAPHAPYTVSDAPLQAVRDFAQQYNVPIHIHLHETAEEVEQAVANTGLRPVQRLQNLGLISSYLRAVHTTQLTDEEIQLFAQEKVHVLHCPESNMKLASGFCPTHALLQAGVNVCLGTDGSASNDDLDILGEMRTAALLAKGLSRDASSVSVAQALQMATLNGAKALGIDAITGSLVVGKAADVTAIDLSSLETQPIYNPMAQLVYSINRDKVTDVWVNGKHLLRSRIVAGIDLHELKSKTLQWRERVLTAIKP